ncbi:MAG: hypothetical protein IT258_20070, partial [Saprospiraceae bacterium]|nr:hypothetical protein [Saprospiraceae bacterium]
MLAIQFQMAMGQFAVPDTIELNWNNQYGPPGFVQQLQWEGDALFAGTAHGLFRSDDLGENWERLTAPSSHLFADFSLTDSLLIASTINATNSDCISYGIGRSIDHGLHFAPTFT